MRGVGVWMVRECELAFVVELDVCGVVCCVVALLCRVTRRGELGLGEDCTFVLSFLFLFIFPDFLFLL